MSLQPIPNQPVGFVPTRLQGALCGADPAEVLPIADGDNIGFQFRFGACGNTGEIGDPTFTAPNDWRNLGGWLFGDSSVCKVQGSTALALGYAGWVPDPGTKYQLTVVVTSLSGNPTEVNYIRWSLGGVQGFMFGAGTYTFVVDAVTAQPLVFTASSAGTFGCMSLAQIEVLEPDNEVRIVDLDGDTIETFNFDTDPQLYDYTGGFMTLNIPANDAWGNCFRIEVDDPCTDATFTSQVLNFADPSKTIKIRACNVSDSMGFGAGFTPEARYIAKLVRSTFDYEEGVERGTNGFVNNYYVERLRDMSLCVDDAGEFAHDFLSSLPLWDHVYFGQQEYHVKAEAFEPDWGDIYEAHGSLILPVEPKQEAMRKVRTEPDLLGGCVPPPNYLVQGTGPNNNYITLNSGGRIRLHN
jgi:hypothetical protein